MLLLVLWPHEPGLDPLVEDDIPGVLNVELCISRCEVEWFITGGNAEGLWLPRDTDPEEFTESSVNSASDPFRDPMTVTISLRNPAGLIPRRGNVRLSPRCRTTPLPEVGDHGCESSIGKMHVHAGTSDHERDRRVINHHNCGPLPQ